MMEIWKPVLGYESHYQVSNLGRVKRIAPASGTKPGKILKIKTMKIGYQMVYFSINHKGYYRYIHRIVAETFLGNIPNKMEINHKDGNPRNNKVDNLEFMSHQQNMIHARDILGVQFGGKGERHRSAKLKGNQVKQIRKLRNKSKLTYSKIGSLFGITEATARSICIRTTWRHI